MKDAEYYKKLGFKCGLEIHQRLATREKLFCSCSTDLENDMKVGTVERRQRAVAGELGVIDRSTSFESSRGRSFVYNVFRKSSCLVDIDEEPPHGVNDDAVETAIRFASAFNARIPDEIEPMRKEVVDGSDPSAFQRSMMVAYDGRLQVNGRTIPITSIFLEEESSGIEGQSGGSVVYNVDRIGIPLIEIDTDPSIQTPKEAAEVALRIGLTLRLTGRKEGDAVSSEVQRGIGTIRQDVNVSILGGTRVEVKGLQEIESMALFIENEVERQLRLIELKKALIQRHAVVDRDTKELTDLLGHEKGRIIADSLSRGGIALGARLQGFAGHLGAEINPDRRLGSEISDYARMAGVRGIIHSDEDLQKYGLSYETIKVIGDKLGVRKGDAFILIVADRQQCEKAMKFALDRAAMALSEVPPETRAVADSKKGTTRFMRPLPGGSRMYPETDALPIEVRSDYIKSITQHTIYLDQRISNVEAGLSNRQIGEQMVYSQHLPLYEYIISKVKGINLVVATTLLEKLKELERAGIDTNISRDVFVDIFGRYSKGEITKAGIGEVMRYSPESARDVTRIIKEKSLERISGERLRKMVEELTAQGGKDIIREMMSRHRLNIDGEELNKLVGDRK